MLPSECPTSIEGERGRVRYEIVVRIMCISLFDNVFKQRITVLKPVDLNLNSSYKVSAIICLHNKNKFLMFYKSFQLPVSSEYIRSSCWPCWSGMIMCTLEIPFGAYISGQLFKFSVLINNQSNSHTGGYSYEFKQKITYTANQPVHEKRHERNVLVSDSISEQCLRFSNRLFEDAFTMPEIPPSTDSNSIVCVQYFLKVKVNMPDCCAKGVLKIPVIIGTIPITESLDANQYTTVPLIE